MNIVNQNIILFLLSPRPEIIPEIPERRELNDDIERPSLWLSAHPQQIDNIRVGPNLTMEQQSYRQQRRLVGDITIFIISISWTRSIMSESVCPSLSILTATTVASPVSTAAPVAAPRGTVRSGSIGGTADGAGPGAPTNERTASR